MPGLFYCIDYLFLFVYVQIKFWALKGDIFMKQELIYEFPSQLAETYNDICSGLEKYDFSKVKKGSKVKFKISIKWINGDFRKLSDFLSEQKFMLSNYLYSKIKKIYNTDNINLVIDIDIQEGSILYVFVISLEVLKDISMIKFRMIIGTILVSFGIIWGSGIAVQKIKSESDIAVQEIKSRNTLELAQIEQQKQTERINFVLSSFEKNGIILSGEDIVNIVNGKENETVNNAYEFLRENPIKHALNIPKNELELDKSKALLVNNKPLIKENKTGQNNKENNQESGEDISLGM